MAPGACLRAALVPSARGGRRPRPAAARLHCQEAWALDPPLVIRVVCDWEVGHPTSLNFYGGIFLWIVEPSLDGLSRIVAACEDAYAYARERFPWSMIWRWQLEIRWQVELQGPCPGFSVCQSGFEESWPLIGAGLEAWADQQLAATFTRDFLDYSTERDARVDTNLLDSTARAWSARWEDRTKAGAFMAAMGPIREEISRQIADEELRLDTPREYRSDSDEEDY